MDEMCARVTLAEYLVARNSRPSCMLIAKRLQCTGDGKNVDRFWDAYENVEDWLRWHAGNTCAATMLYDSAEARQR